MHRLLPFALIFALNWPLRGAEDAQKLWSGGVQALLDENCVKCHGPLKQKSGLELDSVASILKGAEDGAVIDPAHPETSKLLAALAPDADPHMPPKKQFTDQEVSAVKRWVAALAATSPPAAAAPIPPPPPGASPSAAIDHFLAASWQQRELTPAPACDDPTFVRRVYLDLAGCIPSPDQTRSFLAAPHREALVDQLLAGLGYPTVFREVWDAILMGRHSARRLARRESDGWFAFLEAAFRENRPWDAVVRAMITARAEQPEDRGASLFLYERRNEYQQIAEAIAPIIYGTRIDCAQCHDHPLAREIKQAHYWGLVAAFNRGKNAAEPAVDESAVGGFINFTNLKKEPQPALITTLSGRTIEEVRPAPDEKEDDTPAAYRQGAGSGKVPKFSRREALAEAVTQGNPLLARAFVNYTWAILLGRGIVYPVDEINSKHPPSQPELLDWLATDFAAHQYDVRRLIRAIVLSRPYSLAAPASSEGPPPEAFAAAVEKPLLAETVFRSLCLALGSKTEGATADSRLRQEFVEAFPDVLPRVPRSTIQQAVFVENSPHFAELFRAGSSRAIAEVAALADPAERVRSVFARLLVREPDGGELARGVAFLNAGDPEPEVAVGQLFWALATGPEFMTNH